MSPDIAAIESLRALVREDNDPVSRARAKAQVRLWQATWEAGGYMTEDEIRELVERTLAECRADQP